ncbi:glutathione S-transferase C-terminal domain-containing protein [Synechococcus sp. MIT S9451]|uniref:glutathione S-transferase C-terminal domain-containing protein n=1 Tax=Synechococcus sp. MIT S9451 TaxID=3082543 RepID=UPI0039B64B2E
MAVPPLVIATARDGWRWQWRQLMQGLGPADAEGRYVRPPSDRLEVTVPSSEELLGRSMQQQPRLVIGRSCPWAHRTWLMHRLRQLEGTLTLLTAKADHRAGRWSLAPSWLGCDSLLALYRHCGTPPHHRATVPALVDPGNDADITPRLLGNDSAALSEALNHWPGGDGAMNLAPTDLLPAIERWQSLLQPAVNDGVYRCGFARTQQAYNEASAELFAALEQVEAALQSQGPWLCGEPLTIADVRLFPTLIRWELVYAPLFGCSARPLWMFPALWRWRQRFYALPGVANTCDGEAWRADYFGALFPLNPGGLVPAGPDLSALINAPEPLS